MTPRAITGFGVACTLGVGREAFLAAIRSNATLDADGPIETFDGSRYPKARVAEVRGFDAAHYLGDKGLRTLDRLTKLLVVSARLALHDAGLKRDGSWIVGDRQPGPADVGLVCSNAYGSLEAITELDRVAVLEDPRYINPSRFPLTVSNSAAGYVSIWEDLRALNVSVSDGNCGALDAMACGDMLLDQGRAEILLAGGAEAMSEALFLAFHRLGAIGSTIGKTANGAPARPCLGEGSALVALESLRSARARSASVLAEIVGYGTSFAPPAREGSLIHASAEALHDAIAGALTDAGVTPDDVDVVISGLSGIRAFDDAELSGIERALGGDVPIVAPKLALGETLGAGGALAILAAVAQFENPIRDSTSAVCGHIVRGTARPNATPRVALVTALGYYGNASAVVLRAASSQMERTP